MSQVTDYNVDNSTGANVRADINAILDAIRTNNSGGSDNGSVGALGFFANTSSSKLQLKNAAGNAFINLRGFDGTLPLPDGSAASPSLFFDDDTDTGIFSGGANQFQITTGGAQRLKLDGTEVVFNDNGTNTDFRIEGDTDSNLFFVDAGNDRVGIGTISPSTLFHCNLAAENGSIAQFGLSGQTNNQSFIIKADDSDSLFTFRFGSTNSTYPAVRFNMGADAEALRITSSGDFCVGTTSAIGKSQIATSASEIGLTVSNDTHDSYLQILATAANKNSAIFFGDNGDGNIGAIDYDHNDNSLSFSVNGGEKARLESAGSLLIGTTTTTGTSSSGNDIVIGSIGDSTDRGITLATSGTGTIRWADAGDNAQGRIQYSNSSDVMTLHTNNVERFRIDSTGRTGINVLDDNGGFVQMKPNHNFDDGASGIQSSGTRATLRVRTSSNSSMSLYIGGLDDSIDSARPYLQVGNRSAGGPTAFYDLYLCPFGGTVRTLQIIPKDDNSHDLGAGDKRWDDVFATNGTINTSDRNEKNTIVDSDLGLSFINKLKPVSYKFNGKTRTHYGLIAQDIETVLSDISKSTTDFAGFIKAEVSDVLYTEDEPLPTGKNVGDVKTPGTTNYGLRYAEFIAPLVKAVQELSDKVAALEAA